MLLKANFYLLFGTCIEQSIEKMRCLAEETSITRKICQIDDY